MLDAERVNTLAPVAGLGEKLAVTPTGKPDIASFTELDEAVPAIAILPVVVPPGAICIAPGPETDNTDDAGATMTRGNVVVAVWFPQVPWIVTVLVPAATVVLVVSVSTPD